MDRQSTTHQNDAPLRIVLTGGGTGGHVSPILAVLDEFECQNIALNPLWIGSKHGAERAAAEARGIAYRHVSVGKLRRYVSLHTVPDAARVPLGVAQSLPILRRFRPDVIFSTGGYVGVPAVVAGRTLGIPALTHEQTALLGLATRINARFSQCVALSHEETPRPTVSRGGRVTVTGNPIRARLRAGDGAKARDFFGLEARLPLLYITGGAQGALALNDTVAEVLPQLLEHLEIIHQTGPDDFNGSYSRLRALQAELPPHLATRYHLTERTGDELADIYACAALVLSRAGAGTVAELAALALPSILVPLPGALEQRENARVLESAGATVVIDQEDLTPGQLVDELTGIVGDSDRLGTMTATARSIASDGNPAALLVAELLRLAGRKQNS